MKKLLSSTLVGALMFGALVPGVAGAQTFQENLTALQNLMQQIAALQTQLRTLQQQQQDLRQQTNDIVIDIVKGLKNGSEGDEVTLLQTLLSSDSSIYPEGIISGYYGPLTARAIQRFQAKHDLEQVGFVGRRTREALMRWAREQFKEAEALEDEFEDDDIEEIENAIASIATPSFDPQGCDVPSMPAWEGGPKIVKDGKTKIIQTGNVFIYKDGKKQVIITPNSYHEKDGKKKLLITPGMRYEKDGKFRMITPCNGGTVPNNPSDTTAPTISSVVASPAQTSVGITWSTNESATGKVYFGTMNPLVLEGASSQSEAGTHVNHAINIAGLTSSTTYYFVVESKDAAGNTATSSQMMFTTNAVADTVDPVLSSVVATNVGTSSATISWSTNELSDSEVYYGTTTPLNKGTALTKESAAMVTNHSLALTGLMPNTTYYFIAESKDAANNSGESTQLSFMTAAIADTTDPVISGVAATPATTTAQVNWTTDEAATSKVYYGTATPLVLGSALTATSASLVTTHSLELAGLTASTTYYYVVESVDGSGNDALSTESSFATN